MDNENNKLSDISTRELTEWFNGETTRRVTSISSGSCPKGMRPAVVIHAISLPSGTWPDPLPLVHGPAAAGILVAGAAAASAATH